MDACCLRPRSTRPPLRTIRVVHLDGLIEEYTYPTTIDEVTAVFPKHFMTTPVRILQIGLIPLKLDTQLEAGRIYFLLPYAILRFNDSSDNLICLTRRLTNIAKTGKFKTKPVHSASHEDNVSSQTNKPEILQVNSKPPPSASPQVKISRKISLTRTLSNIAKPSRSKAKRATLDSLQENGSSPTLDGGSNGEKVDMRRSTKGRFSWKPLLSTVREFSFNRRESDLSFNRRESGLSFNQRDSDVSD